MTGLLIITHLTAIAVGAIIGGAYASLKVRERETATEFRGMRATVIAHSPEDAVRFAEGL